MPELIEHPAITSVSPSAQSGNAVFPLSSPYSPYTPRQPALRTMQPFASNARPSHLSPASGTTSATTVAVSFTHSSENASTMRPAIMS